MLKAKVCVLVSGGGTNLQAIIDAQKSGIINSAEVSVVVASNPNAYALERAKNNGIPFGGFDCFDPSDFSIVYRLGRCVDHFPDTAQRHILFQSQAS